MSEKTEDCKIYYFDEHGDIFTDKPDEFIFTCLAKNSDMARNKFIIHCEKDFAITK